MEMGTMDAHIVGDCGLTIEHVQYRATRYQSIASILHLALYQDSGKLLPNVCGVSRARLAPGAPRRGDPRADSLGKFGNI
jgi:hypothetical protein